MSDRVDSNSRTILNRRSFLGLAPLPPPRRSCRAGAGRRAAAPAKRDRTLSFFHTHTGERLKMAYCCDGEYQPEALAQLNHLLRDFRVNEVKPIDPQLLDLLHELGGTLETDQPFHIISGYRSPKTNTMLRERGGAHTGVASHSLHMVGKAIDIRVPGVKLDQLRGAARLAEARRRRLLPVLELRPRRHRARALLVASAAARRCPA